MESRKHRILFVDDDELLIRGIHRSIEEYDDIWDVFVSTSGEDALAILTTQPIDVLICDIRMPGMDGNQLLELVYQKYPSVIRFVLSGNSEEKSVMLSTRLAHQFIAKPCKMDNLIHIVERACRLQDRLSNPNLFQTINGICSLPSIPRLYKKLIDELHSGNATPKVVGEIIAHDVTMSAKVLQLVNSAFFGLPNHITRVEQAVNLLGLYTIRTLVLGVQIFSEYQNKVNPHLSVEDLWNHSLLTGNISQTIAQNCGFDQASQSDAQVSGMLHDIGKMIIPRLPNYPQQSKNGQGETDITTEYETFGVSHAELGAYLLGIWGLPDTVVEAIALHHFPEVQSNISKPDLAMVVYIANGLCNRATALNKKPFESYFDLALIREAGLECYLPSWSEMTQRLHYALPQI